MCGGDADLGGRFRLELFLPEDYPMAAPKVRFLTRIYHPNIGAWLLTRQARAYLPRYSQGQVVACAASADGAAVYPGATFCAKPRRSVGERCGRPLQARRKRRDRNEPAMDPRVCKVVVESQYLIYVQGISGH